MQEKKDWNGIRGYIDHIFDDTDIGNNAKKFADNVVESLREVDTHTKENFEKNKVSVKSNVNKRNTAKIYLRTNRSDLLIRIFVGLPMMIFFGIPIFVLTLTVLPISFTGWVVPMIALIPFFGIGAFLAIPAIGNLSLVEKADRYYRIMNNRTYMNIEDIAAISNESPEIVVKNLKKMIEKRIFTQGHLDKDNKCFMLSHEVYKGYLALEEQRESEQRKNDIIEKKVDIKDGSLISEGREYIISIKELHLGITKEPMSSKLTKLETILTAIFDRVEKEPKETEKLYKLMKYYLPTTVKLIKTYSDFDNVISPDSDILNTKKEIELTIDSINEACGEFQNRLFKDTAFDADTDAALLKVMLAKEGLIGGGMEEDER